MGRAGRLALGTGQGRSDARNRHLRDRCKASDQHESDDEGEARDAEEATLAAAGRLRGTPWQGAICAGFGMSLSTFQGMLSAGE